MVLRNATPPAPSIDINVVASCGDWTDNIAKAVASLIPKGYFGSLELHIKDGDVMDVSVNLNFKKKVRQ